MALNPVEIKKLIHGHVGSWQPRIWSWPHDSFMHQPWGYAVHEASFRAWNAEERKTDCVKFLLEWATEENIEAAIND
jgi:hypothetical protein